MCFSERVSWATFAASMAGVAAALSRSRRAETRVLALTLAVVGSMQLFEALLWRDPSNDTVARAAMVVNHIQPLVFWALAAALLPARREPWAPRLATAAIVAYTVLAASYTARMWSQEHLATIGPHGLEWQWNYGNHGPLMYALFVGSLCATAWCFVEEPGPVIAIVLGTYLASLAIYRDTKMAGSMWCFFAALLPWLLVV